MSPSAERPTIIACPGAFHDASPYMNSFIKSLKAAGFEAEAHGLTTPGHPENGVTDDEKMMRDAFVPHIEAGNDVVLLVHSYAGFPGCGAVSGYDKKGREARGEKGGLLGVVYIAAFVPQEADSTVSAMLGGGWAPWHVPRVSAFHLLLRKPKRGFGGGNTDVPVTSLRRALLVHKTRLKPFTAIANLLK